MSAYGSLKRISPKPEPEVVNAGTAPAEHQPVATRETLSRIASWFRESYESDAAIVQLVREHWTLSAAMPQEDCQPTLVEAFWHTAGMRSQPEGELIWHPGAALHRAAGRSAKGTRALKTQTVAATTLDVAGNLELRILLLFESEAPERQQAGPLPQADKAAVRELLATGQLRRQAPDWESFCRFALDHVTDAILATDDNGLIDFANGSACVLLDAGRSSILGQNLQAVLDLSAADIRAYFAAARRGNRATRFEARASTGGRGYARCSIRLRRLSPLNSGKSGYLLYLRDVADIQAAEKEFLRRSEELESLVYLVSHNLKTPIVSVEGFANLVLEEAGSELSLEQTHYLHRIRKNIHLMNHMISDMLDFSRFGKMEPVFERVSAADVVTQIVTELELREKNGNLKISVAPDLPVCIANREGLATIFQNLISNAVKYRHPERPAIIRIECETQPRFVAFHVRDNGIGIEPEFRQRAFGLFQRGMNVGDIEGTGVGLSICRRIIEKHNGILTFTSDTSSGTSFSFTLPNRAADAPAPSSGPSADS